MDRKKMIIGGASAIAAVFVLFIFFDVIPQLKEANELQEKHRLAQKSVKNLTPEENREKQAELEENLKSLKDDLQLLRQTVELLKSNALKEKNIPVVILEIEDLAGESKVELISVKPFDSSIVKGYEILPIEIRFRGSYKNLVKFLSNIEKSNKVAAVTDLSVEVDKDIYPKLSVKLTPLILFSLKEIPEETSPVQEKKAK